MSGITLDESIRILSEIMFPLYGFRRTIFNPLTHTSLREVLFVMFRRLPVIKWSAILYINVELVIRRLRLEVVNVETMKHVLVIK